MGIWIACIFFMPLVITKEIENPQNQLQQTREPSQMIGALDKPNVWAEFKTKLRSFYHELTEPKVKNKYDICIWKICSRPLKKDNEPPEKEKAVEHLKNNELINEKAIDKLKRFYVDNKGKNIYCKVDNLSKKVACHYTKK